VLCSSSSVFKARVSRKPGLLELKSDGGATLLRKVLFVASKTGISLQTLICHLSETMAMRCKILFHVQRTFFRNEIIASTTRKIGKSEFACT
jgi:hypothetical protein